MERQRDPHLTLLQYCPTDGVHLSHRRPSGRDQLGGDPLESTKGRTPMPSAFLCAYPLLGTSLNRYVSRPGYRTDERGISTVRLRSDGGWYRSVLDLVRHELASQRLAAQLCILFVVGLADAVFDNSNTILPYGRLRGCKSNTVESRLSNVRTPQERPFGTSNRPYISTSRKNRLMCGPA